MGSGRCCGGRDDRTPGAGVSKVGEIGHDRQMERPTTRISATVLGAPDPQELADFYEELLGWIRVHDEAGWVMLRPPEGGAGLSFQHEPHFEPPVWPAQPGTPSMTMHLDIAVDDLDAGVAWATSSGATAADHQLQDNVRVMVDPVGNPFCLFPAPPAVQQFVDS